MDDRVRLFRDEVRRLGGPSRGRRYPGPLRDLAVAICREAVAAGDTPRQVAAELQVSEPTLRRWLDAAAPGPVSTFREVVLADPEDGSRLTVVSPRGYRVEGLSLADLTTLLRALR